MIANNQTKFISPLEWKVLVLFIAGFSCNYFYTKYSLFFVVVLYIFGLVFEYSTKPLWTYSTSIKNNFFTIKGINILMGLGWVGVLLLGIGLAKFLLINLSINYWLLDLMLGIGIIGNLAEQLFYKLNLFTYNMNSKLLAFPAKKIILIWHLPLSVRTGYFISIPLVVYLLLKFFQ